MKNRNIQKNLVLQDRTRFYSNTKRQSIVAAVQGLEDQAIAVRQVFEATKSFSKTSLDFFCLHDILY